MERGDVSQNLRQSLNVSNMTNATTPAWNSSTTTDSTNQEYSWWKLVLGIFVLITLSGNILTVTAIIRVRSLRTVTNLLILSLAVADLTVGVLVMPLAVYVEVANGRFELPPKLCDAWVALDVLACTASIVNLTAISIDRYIAIMYALRYNRSFKNSTLYPAAMIIVSWVVSISVALPIALGQNDTEHRIQHTCQFFNPVFSLTSSVASFIIPTIIMLVLYWKIFKVIKQRAALIQKKKKKTVTCMTTHDQNSAEGSTKLTQENAKSNSSENNLSLDKPLIQDSKMPVDPHYLLKNNRRKREETSKSDEPNEQVPLQSASQRQDSETGEDAQSGEPTNEKVPLQHALRNEDSKISESCVEPYEIVPPQKSFQNGDSKTSKSAENDEQNEINKKALLKQVFHNEDSNESNSAEKSSDADDKITNKEKNRKPSVLKVVTRKSSSHLRLPSATNNYKNVGASRQFSKAPIRSKREKRERRATITLLVVLCVFLICWIPFFVVNNLNAICLHYDLDASFCHMPAAVYSSFVWLGYINSTLNPIIYAVMNMSYRKAFKQILCCFSRSDYSSGEL